ncbi:unnamed protein product [Heterobilharzia americana]|nr:unnamed protein product [Heterobilharzia americana]
MKKIISDLEAGRPIKWTDYNFYTLANIAKRYLLHIEGGILGPESEEKLLSTLDIPDDQARIEAMHSVIVSQSKPVQQLLALLFGIWFRMIYHTEVNAMSVEAVAKSVAGSVFPSCTTTPRKVERASKVMEYLITGFASADLFSRELIEYFTLETKTSISRVEKFKYEFRFPKDVPREKSVRLFVRMLLEEGRKYGFHLINDAVSEDVFEKATWVNTSNPILSKCLENSKTDQINSPSDDRLCIEKSSPNVSNVQNLHINTHSPRRENQRGMDTDELNLLTAPIQQTSEKRTCVTTTPIAQKICDPVVNLNPRRTHDFANPIELGNSSHPPNSSNPTSVIPSLSLDGCKRYNNQIKSPAYRAPKSPATCFNSVKRRQLERLRLSTGLIHLNPNTVATEHDVLSDTENAMNKSANNNNHEKNFGSRSIVPIVQYSSSDVDSSSAIDIEVSEDPMVNDHDGNMSHFDVDEDDIGKLVFTAPERVWNCADVKAKSVTTGCKRHLRTLLPDQTMSPDATSSPNWQTDDFKNYPLNGLPFNQLAQKKRTIRKLKHDIMLLKDIMVLNLDHRLVNVR